MPLKCCLPAQQSLPLSCKLSLTLAIMLSVLHCTPVAPSPGDIFGTFSLLIQPIKCSRNKEQAASDSKGQGRPAVRRACSFAHGALHAGQLPSSSFGHNITTFSPTNTFWLVLDLIYRGFDPQTMPATSSLVGTPVQQQPARLQPRLSRSLAVKPAAIFGKRKSSAVVVEEPPAPPKRAGLGLFGGRSSSTQQQQKAPAKTAKTAAAKKTVDKAAEYE